MKKKFLSMLIILSMVLNPLSSVKVFADDDLQNINEKGVQVELNSDTKKEESKESNFSYISVLKKVSACFTGLTALGYYLYKNPENVKNILQKIKDLIMSNKDLENVIDLPIEVKDEVLINVDNQVKSFALIDKLKDFSEESLNFVKSNFDKIKNFVINHKIETVAGVEGLALCTIVIALLVNKIHSSNKKTKTNSMDSLGIIGGKESSDDETDSLNFFNKTPVNRRNIKTKKS